MDKVQKRALAFTGIMSADVKDNGEEYIASLVLLTPNGLMMAAMIGPNRQKSRAVDQSVKKLSKKLWTCATTNTIDNTRR